MLDSRPPDTAAHSPHAEIVALRAALAREQAAREQVERLLDQERALRLATVPRTAIEPIDAVTLEVAQAGFWELELATGHTTWTDANYRILGYEPGEVTPSWENFQARIHVDDRAWLHSDSRLPSATTDFRIVLPDGSTRWVRSNNQTVFDGDERPVRVRGIVADITAEKVSERQRDRLAEVANRTKNAVIVTDAAGSIEWINAGFTQLTGYTLAEVLGRRPGQVLQGPDTSVETRAEMHRAVANGEPFDVVVLNYSRDGRQYWLHAETSPLHDGQGRLTGFISVQTDLTEQRIAASRENLAQRVAALLLESDSLATAGEFLVQELVRELDIRTAQLWLVHPGQPTLAYLAGASSDASGAAWLSASRELFFHRGTDWVVGVGAPGTAWGTAKTYVRTDFWSHDQNDRPSRRALAAKATGIRTVCAVPVFGTDGVIAVLEVGGSHSYPGYDRLPSLLERTAEQVASFILQDESRRAFTGVFQLSPDALLLVDASGIVRTANARATAMFGPSLGRPIDDFIDDAASLVTETLAARTDAAPNLIKRGARDGDGATFSAELTLAATASSSKQATIIAVRDLTERHKLEAELTRSLREKVTLLQEVHHRVKNNLQIISSMVSLQADSMGNEEVQTALLTTVHRVRTVALVHEQLYGHEDLSRIAFDDYSRSLCSMLRGSLGPTATIEVEAEHVEISIERAVPCGLILNELVTNALKHGRSPDGHCDVRVRIERSAAGFAFVVADRGPGFAATGVKRTSMGEKLIRALVRQLRAKMTVSFDGGATVRVELPAEPPSSR